MREKLLKNWLTSFSRIAACSFVFAAFDAGAVCVPFAGDNQIQVGIATAPQKELSRVNEVLNTYLGFAKKNDVKKIVSQYSPMDGSAQYLDKELRQMPDKFSSYASISRSEIENGFVWGNYVMTLVDYVHARGQATMLEAFFCTTNVCRVSNVFERPTSSEDLASRFIYRYRVDRQNVTDCPSSAKASFNVFPSTSVDDKNPLTVYLNIDSKVKNVGSLFSDDNMKRMPKNLANCANQMANLNMDVGEAELLGHVQSFVSSCAKNMKVTSLTPVYNFSSNKKTFLTPLSVVGFLREVVDANLLYSYKDGANQVDVYMTNNVSGDKYLVVLPIVKEGKSGYFDWSYFSRAAGELLVSPEFATFIKQKHPGLFK